MYWSPPFKPFRMLLPALCVVASTAAFGAAKPAILPAEIALNGSSPRQALVVEMATDGQFTGEVTSKAALVSSDPAVVKIESGAAVAVKDGAATITATVDGQTVTAPVKVSGLGKPEMSFRNHVQPILAKTGCSMGACHGAAAGQGGFKLSLRGYDDEGDFLALTRGAMGRRITPADPARSLLLLKPTAAVPHKGGDRFKVNSPEWNTLVGWIANGLPAPSAKDPRMEQLEVLPATARLAPGQKQQVLVRAHFSDGHVEDVTTHAKFTAVNQSVVNVDDNGLVSVIGHGESAVSVWYLQKIAVGTVTAPFENKLPADLFTQAPRRNWIDALSLEKLQSLSLPPSPRCTDPEFIRRAFLDAIGVLPAPEETRAFLADTAPDKRDRLIERLLARPEFVDYWSYKWSDLLLVTKRKLQPAPMWAYYQWIRNAVASNMPWDRFARELLTAQGSSVENGAANYFVIHSDPREAAETTALTFLGFSMNCAKCHNHPMEKWTNNDYYGFANLFSRVRMKNGEQAGENIVFAADEGELVQPLTGKPQAPRPLGGTPLKPEFDGDRRTALADWLTSPQNEQFKRTVVNRIWANFFGVGLVENVDDIRASNPASNEQLFARAAEFLVEQKYDLRALMREILRSETYQRSSVPVPGNEGDTRFYSRYFPRRLMAEVLHDAIAQVTRIPTEFKTRDTSNSGDKGVSFPRGWRAMQLPDANTDSYFTKAFGRPLREQTCECERTAEPSVTQALHVSNGDTINHKLQDKMSCVGQALIAGVDDAKAIDEAYLSAVARPPTPSEKQQLLKVFATAPKAERRTMLEDTYWALLSSKEFLFNH
jgi:hypothetical protein